MTIEDLSKQIIEIKSKIDGLWEDLILKDIPSHIITCLECLEDHVKNCDKFEGFIYKESSDCATILSCSCQDTTSTFVFCTDISNPLHKKFFKDKLDQLTTKYAPMIKEENSRKIQNIKEKTSNPTFGLEV